MIRRQNKKNWSNVEANLVSDRDSVYAALMINSEYTKRAGTGQSGKSPEGNDHV